MSDERPYERAKRLLTEGEKAVEPNTSVAEVQGLLDKLDAENATRKAQLNEIVTLMKAAISKDIENADTENEILLLTKQYLEKKLRQ